MARLTIGGKFIGHVSVASVLASAKSQAPRCQLHASASESSTEEACERLASGKKSEPEWLNPRVSDLVNYKLTRFSLDTLVGMLFRTGKNLDLVVR